MIVMGASSGGLKAMQIVLGGLPKTFPWPVAVVMHRHRDAEDLLQIVLQRFSALPLIEVTDKELIRPGRVYIAPADYHLLVEPNYFSLSTDEPVLYARPSIDVLFESAADVYGRMAVGVVLTGASQDGARGAARIQKEGGTIIVQDPATAENSTMPAAALTATGTRFVRPLEQIAATLIQVTDSILTKKS